MNEWLVIVGAMVFLISAAVMFSELMELRATRGDAEEVGRLMQGGVIGNRWIRLAVQVLVIAGLVLITVGLSIGG